MAYTTINKSTDYFNTKLYTGTGASNSITGIGFQPDLTWIKRRNTAGGNMFTDIVRGVTKTVISNETSAEQTFAQGLTSFDTAGFTVGSEAGFNNSGDTFVGWNWLASNTTASNTDGSITSTVSANTTAGFSIGTYTGTGADATVGHGLGVAPDMIFVKCTSTAHDWGVYHSSLGSGQTVYLNLTNASSSATGWQNTDPTSTVFSIDNAANSLNQSGQSFVFYAFASKKGYSKFGSYVGNGSTNGSYIHTGFSPSFVMSKRTDLAEAWRIMDTTRSPFNVAQHRLLADTSAAEFVGSSQDKDFLSNGFKIRNSDSGYNASGGTYIYMAFGQSIVGNNNVPATAR